MALVLPLGMRPYLLASMVALLSACPGPKPTPCLENPSSCDAPDASVPDGGLPDGGVVDWRLVRGAPYTGRTLGLFEGAPFALSDDGFALATRCDGGACDYVWRDDDGTITAQQPNLAPVATGMVSRDGHVASVLRLDARAPCVRSDGSTTQRFAGDWRLVDVFSGATLQQQPVTTSDFIDRSFTQEGQLARLNLLDPVACEAFAPVYRATQAPYAASPLLEGEPITTWLEAELRAGRAVLSRPPASLELAFMDARAPATPLSSAVTDFSVDGDFVHVFEGWPARELVSADALTGTVRRATLPFAESDWFPAPAADRYAVFSSHALESGRQPFLFVDGRGEHPQRQVIVGRFEGRRTLALAPRAGFAVFYDADAESLMRLDLASGVTEALEAPPGVLHAVGDGQGVVVSSREALWVLGPGVRAQVPGRPLAVIDAAGMGGAKSLPQNQTALLLTSSPSGGEVWLTAWHVPTGRLVRLTDSLFFNPPFEAPAAAAARCEAPGFVRVAGAPIESALQDSAWLHFTEFVPAAAPKQRLFVMPVDLSAPPRLLAEVPSGQCGTPLRAPGGRFWVPTPAGDGAVFARFTEAKG